MVKLKLKLFHEVHELVFNFLLVSFLWIRFSLNSMILIQVVFIVI
jgi:hypothetical protein